MSECVSSRPFLSLPPPISPHIAFQTMANKKIEVAAKHEARIETETKRKGIEYMCVFLQ